jgi:hypothetical protein
MFRGDGEDMEVVGAVAERSSEHRIVSIPQWAKLAALADDGRSIAAARSLLSQGHGPATTDIQRKTRNGAIIVQGIPLSEHQMWTQTNPWAGYLASLPAAERAQRQSTAMRIVGDAAYVTKLYDRYCKSRWRFQMSFEHWLKRRQRQKDRHTPRHVRKTEAFNRGRH